MCFFREDEVFFTIFTKTTICSSKKLHYSHLCDLCPSSLPPYIFGVVSTSSIVPENVQRPNIQLMPMDVRAAELGRVEMKTSGAMEGRSSPDQACQA